MDRHILSVRIYKPPLRHANVQRQSHPLVPRIPESGHRPHRIGPGGSGSSFKQPSPGKGPPTTPNNEQLSITIRHLLSPESLSAPPTPPKTSMEGTANVDSRPPPPWSTSAHPPWSTATRPLSDIREITEPSLADLAHRNQELGRRPSLSRHTSFKRKDSISRKGSLSRKGSWKGSLRSVVHTGSSQVADLDINHPLPPSEQTDQSSAYSLPLENVPPRTSSQVRRGKDRSAPTTRQKQPSLPPPPPRGLGYTIKNRGRSRSPVKELANVNDPDYAAVLRRVSSRTFIRNVEPNVDILDFPRHQHPRISVELHPAASLFVGGGSVEGHVRVVINDLERIRHRRQLAISRISVDLLGVEEMSGSRRSIFLNLATELIDSDYPPPHNMVESLKQISPIDPFWLLAPSVSQLSFLLSLPLDVGPPPFQSKHARIRYVLCATALIRDQGKQYLVRSSQEISVLSVYDPEKALMSLPSPLTASDEYIRHRDPGVETIKVTAGLHRQVWVSGTSIFVDVQIANKSKKAIKRLELQLERDVLCYKHVAATTLEKSASQARIFDNNERTILSKSVMKQGSCGWTGVPSHAYDLRTCDLELPRGHATVKCGKYFEVRYFLNVIVSASHAKVITVQLPIVLIHMNSLDVVPNSVAQVAAAIEEKRAKVHHERSQSRRRDRTASRNAAATTIAPASPTRLSRRPSSSASVQGRAFAAPRKQSLDRMRAEVKELQELGKVLDTSPRKYFYSPRRRAIASTHQPQKSQNEGFNYHTPPSNRKGRVLSDDLDDEVANIRARLRRMRSNETNRSMTSTSHQKAVEASGIPGGNSVGSKSKGSKVGFRELEVERSDLDTPGAPPPSRFEGLSAASARQSQFRKMRSSERWKGTGWFSDKRESREREREAKQKMMSNWI